MGHVPGDGSGSPPLLLVASSGGHLAQLLALEPWYRERNRRWVSFDTPGRGLPAARRDGHLGASPDHPQPAEPPAKPAPRRRSGPPRPGRCGDHHRSGRRLPVRVAGLAPADPHRLHRGLRPDRHADTHRAPVPAVPVRDARPVGGAAQALSRGHRRGAADMTEASTPSVLVVVGTTCTASTG